MSERKELIVWMAVFGLLGIISLVGGICGETHQFYLAGVDACLFLMLYIDYRLTKSK